MQPDIHPITKCTILNSGIKRGKHSQANYWAGITEKHDKQTVNIAYPKLYPRDASCSSPNAVHQFMRLLTVPRHLGGGTSIMKSISKYLSAPHLQLPSIQQSLNYLEMHRNFVVLVDLLLISH